MTLAWLGIKQPFRMNALACCTSEYLLVSILWNASVLIPGSVDYAHTRPPIHPLLGERYCCVVGFSTSNIRKWVILQSVAEGVRSRTSTVLHVHSLVGEEHCCAVGLFPLLTSGSGSFPNSSWRVSDQTRTTSTFTGGQAIENLSWSGHKSLTVHMKDYRFSKCWYSR